MVKTAVENDSDAYYFVETRKVYIFSYRWKPAEYKPYNYSNETRIVKGPEFGEVENIMKKLRKTESEKQRIVVTKTDSIIHNLSDEL